MVRLALFLTLLVATVVVAQNTPAAPYNGTYYSGIDTSLRGSAFQVGTMAVDCEALQVFTVR